MKCKGLFVLVIFYVTTAFTYAQSTLYISAIPSHDTAKAAERFSGVASHLSKELGFPVKYVSTESYGETVKFFEENKIQLAWFGAYTGLIARKKVPGSRVMAQGFEDHFYKTYFIVNTRTGIKLDAEFPLEIKGLSLLFGSELSTSGRLMPEFFIRKYLHGEPKDLFTKIAFSGNHTITINKVQAGEFDVGVVDYAVWLKTLQKGKIDLAKVKIIWETPPYPDYHWVARGQLERKFGKDIYERIILSILNINAKPSLLKAFPRSHFVRASEEDFATIEQIAAHMKLSD